MAVTVQFATGLRVTYPHADGFEAAIEGGWGKVLIAGRNPLNPITIALVSPASSCVVETTDPTVRVEMVPHVPMTAKGE